MTFTHKLVAIINKDIEAGVAMNALAHMTIGLGAKLGPSPLELEDYHTKDSSIYPNISKMPFIILRGKSAEIRKAIQAAGNQNVHFGVFTHTMTGGSYQEQLDSTIAMTEENLIYYGCVFLALKKQ